jgi:hypothetical protein
MAVTSGDHVTSENGSSFVGSSTHAVSQRRPTRSRSPGIYTETGTLRLRERFILRVECALDGLRRTRMSDWSMTAFLFQCQGSDLFAISLDRAGTSIPPLTDNQRWLLREEFQLGLLFPLPIPVEPDEVLRGIEANGYFIFDVSGSRDGEKFRSFPSVLGG